MEALYTPYTENNEVADDEIQSKGGLVGLAIGCRDLITGEIAELNKNYIGEKPVNNTELFKYDIVFCDGKSYFNNIGCNFDESGLNKLIFNKCKNI